MSIYNLLVILKDGDLDLADHPFIEQLNELITLLYKIAETDQYQLIDLAIDKANKIKKLMLDHYIINDAEVLHNVIVRIASN